MEARPMTAPAAMPSEEDVALAIKRAQLGGRAELSKEGPWREHEFKPARAVLALFAPILAEKQKPTVALNHWKARALAAEAALTEIRARHAEWRKCMPADWEGDPLSHAIEAAAIRAQGE
jgi:hypothetical protein